MLRATGRSRYFVWIVLILLAASTLLTGIFAFRETVSDNEFCHDRQERVAAAKEAFIRTQDPLIELSKRNFAKEQHTPQEKLIFDKNIEEFHGEQVKLADKLFKPVHC